MAPQHRPQELMDDAVTEILLHLPPDNPACLTRSSLVCKPWRRLLPDPGFPRRYREFHGTPPLLGFLRNTYTTTSDSEACCFVPITATPPFSPLPFDEWDRGQILDCATAVSSSTGGTGTRSGLGSPSGIPSPVTQSSSPVFPVAASRPWAVKPRCCPKRACTQQNLANGPPRPLFTSVKLCTRTAGFIPPSLGMTSLIQD
ncbi:unnamed protein product [Urochloa humidicola]